MRKRYSYPALFIPEPDDNGGVNVVFPDIFGGVTCGDDEDDALFMAKDLLRLMLTECRGQCRPPKPLKVTQANFPDDKVVLVTVYINE